MAEFLVVLGLNPDRSFMAEGLRVEVFRERLAAEMPEHQFTVLKSPQGDDAIQVVPIIGTAGAAAQPGRLNVRPPQELVDGVAFRVVELLEQSCAAALC